MLVNKYDIRDGARLDELLNDFASVNWAQMRLEPAPERFNVDYLQTIHRRMFDEVLPFAGQLRDVDAQATGVGIPIVGPSSFPRRRARSMPVCCGTTTSETCHRISFLRALLITGES